MKKRVNIVLRWLPVLAVMAAIFYFSSLPSSQLPKLDYADILLKKGGHMTGYALLALGWLRALGKVNRRTVTLTALLCLGYAISDEFHQRFSMGRTPSPWDVLIDLAGTALALWAVIRMAWLRVLTFWRIS